MWLGLFVVAMVNIRGRITQKVRKRKRPQWLVLRGHQLLGRLDAEGALQMLKQSQWQKQVLSVSTGLYWYVIFDIMFSILTHNNQPSKQDCKNGTKQKVPIYNNIITTINHIMCKSMYLNNWYYFRNINSLVSCSNNVVITCTTITTTQRIIVKLQKNNM